MDSESQTGQGGIFAEKLKPDNLSTIWDKHIGERREVTLKVSPKRQAQHNFREPYSFLHETETLIW